MRNNENAYNYLGLNFRQQKSYKKRIRKRDKHTCQLCGEPGGDVGHKIAWHISRDSSPENLYVLCHSCNLKDREVNPGAGRQRQIPADQYEAYLRAELAKYQYETKQLSGNSE